MKNKLSRKIFALLLTLAFAFSITACTPQIHIHTGDSSDSPDSSENAIASNPDTTEPLIASTEENTAIASSDEKTESGNASKTDVETSVASSEKEKTESKIEESTASKNTSSKAPTSSKISQSKAKSIALKDAGIKESEIYDFEIELDYDNGVSHYDVSFEVNGKDYDYEINAETGKIISVDKPKATSSEAKISKSKAKSTALKHAGVKEADISRYKVELEKDDGVWKYEISFNVGNVEFDYTINAENGKILESEKDIDD